jgi:hypothetical protein
MRRTKITAELVVKIEQLLDRGVDFPTITAQFGVTAYVVETIAAQRGRTVRAQPMVRSQRQVHNVRKQVDAVTLGMIERMLAVGLLSPA